MISPAYIVWVNHQPFLVQKPDFDHVDRAAKALRGYGLDPRDEIVAVTGIPVLSVVDDLRREFEVRLKTSHA